MLRTQRNTSVERNRSVLLLSLVLLCAGGCFCSAAHASPNGEEIAALVYNRNDGVESEASVRMTLTSADGAKEIRAVDILVKDYGALQKRLIRFQAPAAIKGTAFLSWEQADDDDEQFLYLPSLHRVRRIAGTQNDKRFVNTDYTYEDLKRRKVKLDRHVLLREEAVSGVDCWVLESVPIADDSSQYSRRVAWIAKAGALPVRAEVFDKDGKLAKVFSALKIEQIQGRWTVTDGEMKDMKENRSTRLEVLNVQYDHGVGDEPFTREFMERP